MRRHVDPSANQPVGHIVVVPVVPSGQQQYPLCSALLHDVSVLHAAHACDVAADMHIAHIIVFIFMCVPHLYLHTKKPPIYLVVRRLITIS